jgi:2-C-methyl-D-erythritol 4-phosphate cytidylyltransferase
VPEVGRAVIAAPAGEERRFARLADAVGDLKCRVVAGGESRSESVAAAVAAAGAELVVVHDAARPLVTPELISAVIAKLDERPEAAGVIAACPLTDTVKRAREPRPPRGEIQHGDHTVTRTESREYLWAAQTPQVFRADALRNALGADRQRLAAATDDAWLVETEGGKVLIHPAPAANLKVTTEFDLRVAEVLLAER